jgi:hypothetical protein
MTHTVPRSVLILAVGLLLAPPAAARQQSHDPWFVRMEKPKDFDGPKVFAGTFSIELPKNWQLAPGHTTTIFSDIEKTKRFEVGAAIILQYQSLQAAFDPSLIDAMGPLELEDVKKRELSGSDFSQKSLKVGNRVLIIIHYDRPGLSGGKDHVVQYEFPVGTTLYKLVCIAAKADLEKYRPIFAHAAASFTPLKG